MPTTSEGEFDKKKKNATTLYLKERFIFIYILLLLFSLGLGLYHVKLAPSDSNLPVPLQRMQFPVRLDDHKQIPGPNI